MTTAPMVPSSMPVSAADARTTGLVAEGPRAGCALRPALRRQVSETTHSGSGSSRLSRAVGLIRDQAKREGLRHD